MIPVNRGQPKSKQAAHGGVLIITLLIAVLIGVTLTSYLMLVRSQSVAVVRSQAWNTALTLAEAGVEEALAQINAEAFNTNISGGNGWVLSDGVYRPNPPEREMLGGRYAVVYTPTAPPVIYSTGYVKMPVTSETITRVIRVSTTNAPLFLSGLSVNNVQNGGRRFLTVNTYDSSDRYHSDHGRYDPTEALTPESTNGISSTPGELPDVPPPFQSGGLPLPPPSGNTYRLSGYDYLITGDFFLPGGNKISVAPGAKAVLYVQGNFRMSSTAELEISTNGSLQLFVQGSSAKLGIVDNQGRPASFRYFGLPGNTNVILSQASTSFVGCIYAPNAWLRATNGQTVFSFEGALTVNGLVLDRSFKFHFDESLLRVGNLRRGFVADSWREWWGGM